MNDVQEMESKGDLMDPMKIKLRQAIRITNNLIENTGSIHVTGNERKIKKLLQGITATQSYMVVRSLDSNLSIQRAVYNIADAITVIFVGEIFDLTDSPLEERILYKFEVI